MQKGNVLIFVLVGILVLAGVAGGAFYLGTKKSIPVTSTPDVTSQIQQATPTPTTAPNQNDETTNWKTYQNTKFGYSFKYSSNYELKGNKDNEVGLLSESPNLDEAFVSPLNGALENIIFSVRRIGKDYSEQAIKDRYMPGQEMTMIKVKIGQIDVYKVTVPEEGKSPSGASIKITDEGYYINAPAGVLEITIKKDNSDALKILSTFKVQ